MNKVYIVVINGNYFYDGNEKIEYGPTECSWIDSYWTDENDAIKEGIGYGMKVKKGSIKKSL